MKERTNQEVHFSPRWKVEERRRERERCRVSDDYPPVAAVVGLDSV